MAQENPRRRPHEEEFEQHEMVQVKHMKFDGENPDHYDVVLLVATERFHVSKIHLAQHSPTLSSLFFGDFNERNKEEVTLNDVDPHYFQRFLELINGVACLTDQNVEGVLVIAQMYLAPNALKSCQQYLIEKSAIATKKRLELAMEYNFSELRNHVISSINTKKNLEAVLPEDLNAWDHATTRMILEKSLNIMNIVYPPPSPQPHSPIRRRPDIGIVRAEHFWDVEDMVANDLFADVNVVVNADDPVIVHEPRRLGAHYRRY